MQGRYPRTVREFAEHNRHVWVLCSECEGASSRSGRASPDGLARPTAGRRQVPNDVLEAVFGPDFDLYAGFAALTAELRCDECGKKHRLILFRDLTARENYGDVGFEEALNRELERRAYVRARGEESMAVRRVRRRR